MSVAAGSAMQLVTAIADLRAWVRGRRAAGERTALVPTVVQRGATVGAGAVIAVPTGRRAFAPAGAVANRDVPDHAVVVGNPVSRTGRESKCGKALPQDGLCGCRRRDVIKEAAVHQEGGSWLFPR